jgi:putative transposase
MWRVRRYSTAMPRRQGGTAGGFVYHVLNRAVARVRIFEQTGDYAAFERVLAEALEREPVSVLAYCIMPNHWHVVVRPARDGQLSEFMRWLTLTHAKRWHAWHRTLGSGHLYQGPFKSFPVASERYFYTVCRYVESNALRAGLVGRAEAWRWTSLWHRLRGDADSRALLADWPEPCPPNWPALVNEALPAAHLAEIKRSLDHGIPFGPQAWRERVARRLGLDACPRPRGRPRKA